MENWGAGGDMGALMWSNKKAVFFICLPRFIVPKCGFLPGNEKLLALLALVKPEVWTLKEKCILVSLGTGGGGKKSKAKLWSLQIFHLETRF